MLATSSIRTGWLVALAALLFFACSEGGLPPETSNNVVDAGPTDSGGGDMNTTPDMPTTGCASSEECGAEEVCANGECQALPNLCSPCAANDDCGEFGRCIASGLAGLNICAVPCVNGELCPTEYSCIDDGNGPKCVPSDGVCEGDPCEGVQCPAGEVCQPISGQCDPRCGADND
jgi:hypothetical protein